MDATVKEILKYLSYDGAKAMWEYLDSDPVAVTDMIAVIAESHKQLAIDLCGVNLLTPCDCPLCKPKQSWYKRLWHKLLKRNI